MFTRAVITRPPCRRALQPQTRQTRRWSSMSTPRILMTGSCGQIGTELSKILRGRYGPQNVITTDVKVPPAAFRQEGPFHYLDVTSKDALKEMVVEYDVNWLIHLSSVLSALGEKNIKLALELNVRGIENVLEVAKDYGLRVYAPSSIAAFGPSTPQDRTPDSVPMRPTTIYGVSKVYLELLGEYYYHRFGVDFRALRYPGVLSSETLPGGGTTDYAIDIFYVALQKKKYICYLEPDVALPMMYMPDFLQGTVQFILADNSVLTKRSYNVGAITFTPAELAAEIRKHIPEFQISFEPDFRNAIARSWPRSLDDSAARADWGWEPKFSLEAMTKDMLQKIGQKIHEIMKPM